MDDWVLCRLYNKKNNPNERIIPEDNNVHHTRDLHPASPLEESQSNNSDSVNSFENLDGEFEGDDVMFLSDLPPESLTKVNGTSEQITVENLMQRDDDDDGNEWLDNLSLEELYHCLEELPPNHDI